MSADRTRLHLCIASPADIWSPNLTDDATTLVFFLETGSLHGISNACPSARPALIAIGATLPLGPLTCIDPSSMYTSKLVSLAWQLQTHAFRFAEPHGVELSLPLSC